MRALMAKRKKISPFFFFTNFINFLILSFFLYVFLLAIAVILVVIAQQFFSTSFVSFIF
jgi:hypothetical protein